MSSDNIKLERIYGPPFPDCADCNKKIEGVIFEWHGGYYHAGCYADVVIRSSQPAQQRGPRP